MELEHFHIRTGGARLHVVSAGPTDGTPVMLLHGFPEFWYGWRHQIAALSAAGFRVYVPDQRGYNESDRPARVSAYHLDDLCADVLDIMDHLGLERMRIVGHDWGAVVLWELATRHPERVDRQVILNVPHLSVMLRTLKRNWRQIQKSYYVYFFQLSSIAETVLRKDNYRALVKALRSTSKRHSFSSADLVEYRRAWAQPGALTGMLNWYRCVVRDNLRYLIVKPELPRIRVPTLILWGARDVALELSMAHESMALCERGRLIVFDDATHWIQHDEPDAVNRHLIAFLKPDMPNA